MTLYYSHDGLFIPPHAAPLAGDEGVVKATAILLKNPIEGFGPLSYTQPIVSNKSFGRMMHVVTQPEGMHEVLLTRLADFPKSVFSLRLLNSVTKEGLLAVHGKQWKRQRRGVAPIFRPRYMETLAPLVNEALDGFKAQIEEGPMDLTAGMSDLTFDVLAKALLGDPKGLDGDKLKQATRRIIQSAGTLRIDDLVPAPTWMPRAMGLKGYQALRRLRKAAEQLIENRRDQPMQDDLVGLLTTAKDPKTGNLLSVREQRDNLIGFFIAGHETTALTLTWALYLVGKHKATEQRIIDEVKSVVGEGPLLFKHLEKLVFTRAVIDETMRLFPPAPLIAREAARDTEILGTRVAKDDIVLLPIYIMHRTARLWERPEVFDPDRFLREPTLNRGKDRYLPFGGGPRVCVGAAFAIMESVLSLAALVRDFEIRPDADCYPKPVMTVTLHPEGGVQAMVKRRPKG